MRAYFCVVLAVLVMFFVGVSANAAEPEHIADYKYWSVYKAADGVRYMVSYPVEDEGNFAKRDRPYFMVTNFNGTAEASVYAGYHYKKGSEPSIVIYLNAKDPSKTDVFSFYSKNDMAWGKSSDKDIALVKSMKLGGKMTVESESTKGTRAKDSYSLEGFSAAYTEIMK